MEDRNRWAPLAFWVPFSVLAALLAVALLVVILPRFFPHGCPPQRQSCSMNLHQLGLAFGSYTCDWDDKFPASDNWPQLMEIYCKNLRICTCPQSDRRSGMRLKIGKDKRVVRVTYSMNPRLKGLAVEDIVRLADTVLLFDSTGAKLAGGPELLPKEVRHEEKHTLAPSRVMINVLFADGHVRQYSVDDVPKLKWDPR